MVEWSPEEQEKSSSKPVGSATCGGAHGSIALDTREWRCSDHTDSSTHTLRAHAPWLWGPGGRVAQLALLMN